MSLCIDIDMPFVTLLKIDEIEKQMIDERMNVGKTIARFTVCGSSCDKSKLFCNIKFNQNIESIE